MRRSKKETREAYLDDMIRAASELQNRWNGVKQECVEMMERGEVPSPAWVMKMLGEPVGNVLGSVSRYNMAYNRGDV